MAVVGQFCLLLMMCIGSALAGPLSRAERMAGTITLDGNTVFFYNKRYEHARIAQWGTGGRDVGTYDQGVHSDQLWRLEESSNHPGYYYIHNAHHEGYRLAKWGSGNNQVGVYNLGYYEDQLWRFQQEGDYYRIYNKKYPSAKITKWGPGNSDWGTYSGDNYNDQLWKIVPRYEASATEVKLCSIDNR